MIVIEIRVGQQDNNRITVNHASVLLAQIQAAIKSRQAIRFVPAQKGRFFCAGYDLSDLINRPHDEVERCFLEFLQIARTVFHAPVPVSVAVEGHAVGFGAMLCLAADHASMHVAGKFRFPEILLGLSLFDDIVSLIRFRSVPAVAQVVLCEAAAWSADEALKHGLISQVHDDEADPKSSTHQSIFDASPDAFSEMKRLCRAGFVNGDQASQVAAFMNRWTCVDTQQRIRNLIDSNQ